MSARTRDFSVGDLILTSEADRARLGAGPAPDSSDADPGSGATKNGSGSTEETADGPQSEQDALRALKDGAQEETDWAATAQAARIADLIADRLQSEPSGLSIGTLALFHDTVSFGGGFNTVSGHGSRGGASAAGSSDSSVPFGAEELDELLAAFIQPDGFLQVLNVLRELHLLVLAADSGTGREAAAANLLAEALLDAGAADGGTCLLVTDPVAVLQPGWQPAKDSGYLVPLDEHVDAAEGLDPHRIDSGRLHAVARGLRASNSYMVVITGAPRTTLAPSADRTPFVRRDLGAVDALAVLERHLLGSHPDSEDRSRLRRLLTDSLALAALRERPEPATAVRLARAIRADRDLAAEVAAVRDPTEQVRAWFSSHEELETLCFVVSAAALEEASYLTVADAAVRLYSELSPQGAAPVGLRFGDRVGREQIWLDIVDAEGSGGVRAGAPVVRFRSPLVRQAVLSYAWTYLDGCRDGLVVWLRRLLTDADVEVRARAAVAAGVMAWGDHRHALHRFLSSWAGSTVWPVRQAAATALGVVAGRPELTEDVWVQLSGWAADGSSAVERRLAKTAATAVGGALGRRQPTRAMTVLRSALDWREDWGNLLPVAWSSVQLFDQGQGAAVLSALLEWSQPQDLSPLVAKSLSVFLFVVNRSHPSTSAEAGSAAPLPRLWVEVGTYRRELEELWARALARKPVQDQALPALRTWIDECGGRDPGGVSTVAELLRGIAARKGKHRDRLLYHLERWAKDPDGPSTVSATLLRSLLSAPH
ncbi:hypothetical protein [Streptacidiphilus sp. MAP5-3]|uniref:hypothetical protein n=1 Tax=unclassified Streptacidiphilus TaxID=2643834 RepID=UPI003515E0A1